jgi:hypothetical protein
MKRFEELNAMFMAGYVYYEGISAVSVENPQGVTFMECGTVAQAKARLRQEYRKLVKQGRYEQVLQDWQNRVRDGRAASSEYQNRYLEYGKW